jgi:hypothetical protein
LAAAAEVAAVELEPMVQIQCFQQLHRQAAAVVVRSVQPQVLVAVQVAVVALVG